MSWKIKLAITSVVLIIFMIMAFIIKKQYDIIEKQNAINGSIIEMQRLQNGVVRSQASYVTNKDLEAALKDANINLKDIKKDIGRLNAELKAVNTTTVVTPGYYGTGISSTGTTDRPKSPTNSSVTVDCSGKTGAVVCPDEFGYLAKRQELKLLEPFSDGTQVPWGQAGFSAWQKKPWDLKVHSRKYSSITVISVDPEGRHLTHSKISIDVDGKTYPLPIAKSELIEKYPESEFRFNPRLYLALDAGGIFSPPAHFEGAGSIQLSMMSYGRTKLEADWTFLNLGIGYLFEEQSVGLVVSPINYNIGKPLPLADNLHVGPSFIIDIQGNMGLMFGLRVGL